MYRTVAEETIHDDARMDEVFGDKIIHWVGIIPGNPSERRLLDRLRQRQGLSLYAHVDQHYLNIPEHEAGRLFRNHPIQEDLHWTVDLLSTQEKDISIHPVAGQMAQLMKLRRALDELRPEDYATTAVILADPSMLTPFLEVFADVKERVNITSGFPMRATLVHRFVMGWLTLHAKRTERKGEYYFYHKHLENLLEYDLVQHWLSGALPWSKLRDRIVARNMKFIPATWLKEQMQGDLFAQEAYSLLFDWPNAYNGVFEKIEQVLSQWKQQTDKLAISDVEAHAIKTYIAKLKQLLAQFGEVLPDDDLNGLKKFVHRQIGYTRLYIEQPKNDALQVMGMLETRMIDFERVWFLGAEDDFLPGSPSLTTHIPFIHRVHFKLPTRKDTEALMAYHFYRLLQRAKQVKMIYSTSTDPLSSGEPSRYILQLKEELLSANPNVRWSEEGDEAVIQSDDLAPLQIYKTDAIIADMKAALARRISPSAINTFINSPLEYYYYYVLRLKEQDEVEEDIELATLGTVVHKVLEDTYQPFTGKLLDADTLEGLIDEALAMVDPLFQQYFDDADLQSGRNLLSVEMAKYYVEAFMRFEVEDLRANGPVEILRLEERMNWKVKLAGVEVNLFGFADRIDRRGGHTRIIDYKTGWVEPKQLHYNAEEWANESEFSKAVQLAIYKFMYCKINDRVEENVGSYIVSFRNLEAGFQTLSKDSVQEDVMHLLEEVVTNMLDMTQPLAHKEDSKYVTF
jgi:RecB family exonuclease